MIHVISVLLVNMRHCLSQDVFYYYCDEYAILKQEQGLLKLLRMILMTLKLKTAQIIALTLNPDGTQNDTQGFIVLTA